MVLFSSCVSVASVDIESLKMEGIETQKISKECEVRKRAEKFDKLIEEYTGFTDKCHAEALNRNIANETRLYELKKCDEDKCSEITTVSERFPEHASKITQTEERLKACKLELQKIKSEPPDSSIINNLKLRLNILTNENKEKQMVIKDKYIKMIERCCWYEKHFDVEIAMDKLYEFHFRINSQVSLRLKSDDELRKWKFMSITPPILEKETLKKLKTNDVQAIILCVYKKINQL